MDTETLQQPNKQTDRETERNSKKLHHKQTEKWYLKPKIDTETL
jgi:hypothetical protein